MKPRILSAGLKAVARTDTDKSNCGTTRTEKMSCCCPSVSVFVGATAVGRRGMEKRSRDGSRRAGAPGVGTGSDGTVADGERGAVALAQLAEQRDEMRTVA